MSDDFDPEFDKLPDQPVTIGGDKSASAWHPNAGPEVPHADLIACAEAVATKGVQKNDGYTYSVPAASLVESQEVIRELVAALGDTVPREDHDQMRADRFSEGWTSAHAHFTPQITKAERERDESRAERDALQRGVVAATERAEAAEAERDALAHVIDQVRAAYAGTLSDAEFSFAAKNVIDAAQAASLALHDAEVKAQALGQLAELARSDAWPNRHIYPSDLDDRAAAIREEAGK